MSLKECFEQIGINNILVIDDDFSTDISLYDLEQYGGNSAAAALQDPDDEDYEKVVELLVEKKLPTRLSSQLASALSDEAIRSNAPEIFKDAANNVLERRKSAAVGVNLVIQWLINEGIDSDKINTIARTEDFDRDIDYDLILIDYYLDDESSRQSVELIQYLIQENKDKESTQLFILMSSHGAALTDDFNRLKTQCLATGSRFRILEKPKIDDAMDKLIWLCTFKQLAEERSLVVPIEKFIGAWGQKLVASAENLSKELWGLDAYSLDVLRQTANNDDSDFEEYIALLLSRHVLAHVEEHAYPKEETSELEQSLNNANTIRQGSEIGDSRTVLQRLLGDVGWHREHWYAADSAYPDFVAASSGAEIEEHDRDKNRFDWFMRHIHFGSVLKNKSIDDEYIVHLTQACDKAHVKCEQYANNHVLLFSGNLVPVDVPKNSNHLAISGYYADEDGWSDVHWNLKKPQTPTIQEFLQVLDKYEIVGQLRHDNAQSIVNKYAATISRVAGFSTPLVTKLKGAFVIKGDDNEPKMMVDINDLVETYLYKKQERNAKGGVTTKNIISFEPDQIMKVISKLDGQASNIELQEELLSIDMDKKDRKPMGGGKLMLYLNKNSIDLSSVTSDSLKKISDVYDRVKKDNSVAIVFWS